MFIPFENLPQSARLWVFQAERKFLPHEIAIIHKHLELFTNAWSTHGQPLQASFLISEERFILLAVNESFQQASGCSIDDSVHVIREIGNLIQQDLFRRDLVSFKMGDTVESIKVSDLKATFKEGKWDKNTLTFNTLAGTKGQLETEWLIPAKNTWLKRYITKEEVAR